MYIEISFKKIGFSIAIGKKSVHHRQVYHFSIDKMFFDDNGDVEFAKQLIRF